MSQLWACYYADHVDRFRRLLALTGHSAQAAAVWHANNTSSSFGGDGAGAGLGLATSPRTPAGGSGGGGGGGGGGSRNARKASAHHAAGGSTLSRAEINSRDHAGLTILLRAAASTSDSALAFVQALLEHPAIDIYVQDPESGWNALHRALYAGNIAIARLLLDKERMDLAGQTLGAPVGRIGQLIKTKDHEGNSPFDLYNSTIGERLLNALDDSDTAETDDSDSDDSDVVPQSRPLNHGGLQALVDGEELFFFGSNKNFTLGLGHGDDRQSPEQVYLRRPDHLICQFYEGHLEASSKPSDPPATATPVRDVADIPALVQGRPLFIHDVVLSKLHSAVLTADPVSNLYVCGIGRGGRLGLGDENTRFSFAPVQGPLADRHIVQVALGQNHTMALTEQGELWTWGSNTFSQLGYTLPPAAKRDKDPMTASPRQVFGPLRKEHILGVAASALHSVAHTGSSLYCWGKNVGQLALMDADSRSLEVQTVPRKVAASLFASPIVAVSAIDKATTCLLANHTVCVFTSYGYNIVKFPFAETYSPHSSRLGHFSMASRYDAGRSQITYIASGGETIAAVTSRGDLFTMHLTNQAASSQAATSTTNPSKIRGALTQPQCIWSARKDGVRSVDVGEQGSVIISTHSGAVWRRVKRAKAKDVFGGGGGGGGGGGLSSGAKRKDYKFQRVPFITNVATVRSSAFGAFAAVRRDSHVIKEQIGVDEQTLWDDVAPLLALRDFVASEPEAGAADTVRFWDTTVLQARLGSVAYEILRAADLDGDLARYLTDWSYRHGSRTASSLGAVVRTSSSPDIRIPVHSWILSARSSVLRHILSQSRQQGGKAELAEVLTVEEEEDQDGAGSRVAVITLAGLDLLSLLNLVLYMYDDKVIPVWNYTRQAPPLAYRYRQVRAEVMKLATRLAMPNLESAVRIQTEPKRTMDDDFRHAMQDSRRFFEDGDAVLELKGAEAPVHSVFLCQRCPWFQGLFHGRSGGQWLAGRRQAQTASDKVRIDLKHMDPVAFQYVLRYLYADTGAELFDSLVSASLDAFFDVVLEVLSIANELMLDRLSQICQLVIGQFSNSRNIAHLLNTISPCSVSEFKDAGLEYICLQMESMLENHLLDDLDGDLLRELDVVVRDNQLTQMPVSKSGRAEDELLQKYPELAQDMDEERQRRVREMAFKATQRDDDRRAMTAAVAASSSVRSRIGSADDLATASSTPDRSRRKASRGGRNEPFSPMLRPQASQADLIFDMEDEDADISSPPAGRKESSGDARGLAGSSSSNPAAEDSDALIGVSPSPLRLRLHILGSSPLAAAAAEPRARSGFVRFGRSAAGRSAAAASSAEQPSTPKQERSGSSSNANPWGPPTVSSCKLDLRSIMTESTDVVAMLDSRASALSTGLDAERRENELGTPPVATKVSQKERKKQQQQQQQQQQLSQPASSSTPAWDTHPSSSEGRRASAPWQVAQSPGSKVSGGPTTSSTHLAPPSPAGPSDAVRTGLSPAAAAAVKTSHRGPRAASPDTRFSGQQRSTKISIVPRPKADASPLSSSSSLSKPTAPLVPHSKVYIWPAPKAEPQLGLSMADIIVQQQREQEVIREAVAKRSLQEIQQEQAFQEWWDQESQRAQEEEARRLARDKVREGGGGGGGGGRESGRGGGGGRSSGRKGGGGGGSGGGKSHGETAAAAAGGGGEEKSKSSSRKGRSGNKAGRGGSAAAGGEGGNSSRRRGRSGKGEEVKR